MSQNSKAKREERKKKETARKQAKLNESAFYVATNPKTGEVRAFETADGVISTYAAVGKPDMIGKLKLAVKTQQDEVVKTSPLSRTNFYMGALIRLPALGVDLLGLVGPVGLEVIPLSVKGVEWLKTHNFAAPDLDDPMEIMLYSAQRIATLEFNRPFRSLADVSEAIPQGVIESMETVVRASPPSEPDTSVLE